MHWNKWHDTAQAYPSPLWRCCTQSLLEPC